MKNFTLTLFLSIVAFITTFAQPTLQWASRFNGPIANDEGKAIALDAGGNVYVGGSSDGLSGTSDFLVLKYNKIGNLLWSRRYDGAANGQDSLRAIKVDALGNVYITGKSQGSGTNINIVTIKYDSTGVQKWASVYNGIAGSNGGYNLEVDVFGNVYVVGSSNPYDVVIKYNGGGILLWSKNLINSYNNQNEIYFAISPYNGHLIVADGGSLTSQYYVWMLHPSTGDIVKTFNAGFNGGYVIYGIPNSIVLDGTGNIYVTSMADPDLFTDKPNTIRTAKFTQASDSYVWYHATSVTGNVQTLSCVDMKIDNDANTYVLAKWFTGTEYLFFTKMLTSSGSQVWAKPSNSAEGIKGTPVSLSLGQLSSPPEIYETGYTSNGNIKIIKYKNNGDTLWTKTYDCGNNGVDIVSKMAIDACDNIYLTGSSNCNGTFKDVKTIKYSALTATITPSGPTTFCQGNSVTLMASASTNYLWSTGATTQNITVSSSGVYSVVISNANGCTAVSSGTSIVVNAIPSITVNSPTICAGQQAILTAGNAASYQWSTGATTNSITVSPLVTTTYTVIGTTANCPSIPASAQVSVNNIPIVGVNSSTICAGQQTILTATGAASYVWSNGATTNSITVSPNSNTTYTVTGTSAQCSSSATSQVIVNPLLAPSLSISGPSVLCLGQNVTFTANPMNGGATPTYQWYVNNNMVGTGPAYSTTTLTNGAQVYCTMVSNAACVSPATATSQTTIVTVLALPIVQITTNNEPTTFCNGGSVTLTANPTGTYKWSPGGATTKSIVVTTSGIYTVIVTTPNSCSAVSAPTTVTVNALPPAPTIFPPGPITISCPGASAILTSSFANAYVWNTGGTAQSISVSTAGSFSVVITDINGCSAASNPTSVLCTVGSSEATLPQAFNIFPNPSEGSFTVEFFLPEAKMVALRVLNVLGQVVWTATPELTGGEYHRRIDLGKGVIPGIYLVETRVEGRVFLGKVEVR